jgi:hypothetical protein
MAHTDADKALGRRNLRTALFLGALALASLIGFIYKVWRLG